MSDFKLGKILNLNNAEIKFKMFFPLKKKRKKKKKRAF